MSPENLFIMGVKVQVTSFKNIAGVGLCTLVSVVASCSFFKC